METTGLGYPRAGGCRELEAATGPWRAGRMIAPLASRRSCASSRVLARGNDTAGSRTPEILCIPTGWPQPAAAGKSRAADGQR